MKLPRVEVNWRRASVELWTSTSVLYIKLCQSWDGQFQVESGEPPLPLWGYRREDQVQLLNSNSMGHTLREQRAWRWWMPYVMIWHVCNYRDTRTLFVPDDDPRVDTTARLR